MQIGREWVPVTGAETTTIRLGTLMSSATFRHPSVLAVIVAQVDQMSDGRVELGLGAGWWQREHEAMGIELPGMAERFDRFEEQLEILDGLWSTPVGESFSFSGQHYTLVRSPALPHPIQLNVPVIIGGDGPKRTPYLAARWAREYNSGWEDPTVTRFHLDRVTVACERLGREPASLRRSTVQTLCAGDSVSDRQRRARQMGVQPNELRGLIGNEADLRNRVADYEEAGVERIYIEILDLADLDHLDYFANAI